MQPFFVYVIRCADGSFYVGHSDDLEKRWAEHQSGLLEGYTQRRHPLVLAYWEDCGDRITALERERQIKRWTRAKKAALVARNFEELHALSRRRSA